MVSKNLVEIIINARDMATETIKNVEKNLKNVENTGKNGTEEVTKSMSRLHDAMDRLNQVSSTVRNGFSTLGNAGKTAINSILSTLDRVRSGFANLGSSISNLMPNFSNVAESIKQKWTGMTENLKSVWNSFTGSLGGIGSSISESLSSASASISGIFQSIRQEASSVSMSFSGIGEGIRESVSGASASISGVFQSIRNEASSVSMSFSGIGEGIRESLSGASASISSVFASIRQEASSLGSSISGSFSNIGSSISSAKNGVLGMMDGMSDLGNVIASSIGVTGVGSFNQLTVGLSLSREKMTTLMRATMGSAEAADTLINKWDSMTDSSVVSLDMMIGAFNKVKMSSGQSAQSLSQLANSQKMVNGHSTNLSSTLIRLGEAAILMGDDAGHAQFVMADAMDGLNGNFRTLQMNLGITKEKLLEQGWSGSSKDVEGYIAALNGCLDTMGDMSSVMDTNAGAIEKLQKAFRVAGRKIGDMITPIIGNLIDMFNWLDQVLDFGATNDDGTHKSMHRLYSAVILVFGALALMSTILPLVSIGLKLYNSAVKSNIISNKLLTAVYTEQEIAKGAQIGLNNLLSLSFWELTFSTYSWLAPLLIITAAVIGFVAIMKYLYDNNETVRHSINVLAYNLNGIFAKGWRTIQAITAPLIPTFQNLWNTLNYLGQVLTGTNNATDEAGKRFDFLETVIYSVGNVFLWIIQTIYTVVQVIIGVLVPVINLVVNILSALIKFVIKLGQAFSLLMQGDFVGFFNTLKDAIVNLVVNIATYVGQALLEIYHNLWSILGNVLTAVIQWLSSLPGIIWGFLLNIPNLLYQLASALLYGLGFLLGLLYRYVTEWQPQLLAMIGGFLLMIGQEFVNKGIPAIISFGQLAYTYLVEAFWNMINGAKEVLPHLPEIIWGEMVRIGEFIWNAGGMILSAILGLCNSIIQGFLDALGIHSPGIMSNAIRDEMVHIAEFILNAVPNIITAIMNLASQILANFRDFISQLPEMITQIFGEGFGGIVEMIVSLIIPAINTLLLLIQQFVIFLTQIQMAVGLLMQGDYSGFLNLIIVAITEFVTNCSTILLGFITYVWNWGVQVKDYVVNTAINMVNGFIQWLSTLPAKAWTWLQGVINKIIAFASSAPQRMYNAAVSIYNRFKEKVSQLPKVMWDELVNIKNKIVSGVGMVVDAMKNLAQSMIDKFKDTLGIHSPGLISKLMGQEMVYTSDAIGDSNKELYKSAQDAGQNILNGFESVDLSTINQNVTPSVTTATQPMTVQQPTNIQPIVDPNTQTDMTNQMMEQNTLLAENIGANSEVINTDLNNTALTLNNLSLTSTLTTQTMEQNNLRILTSFNNMVLNVNTALTTLVSYNNKGWNDVKSVTLTNLNSILTSTKSVTTQMINAWNTMKTSIVNAANNIKTESTNRFNSLWSTIKTFYHNIQHPGGAGTPVKSSRGGGRGFSSLGSALKTGLSSVVKPRKRLLTSADLNGVIPTNTIGYMAPSSTQMVATTDVMRFLNGYENSGAGWDSVVKPNTKYIKDKSSLWSVAGPVILGKYPTGLDIFKVRDFENGTPTIGFDTFKRMAEAVFSQCHYEFYFDSAKYGNWQTAARGGGMNCSDSTDFLIALAHACGLPASKVHGHWNNIGHFWANVAGHKLDTTGWMLHRNWTPAQSHAGPSPTPKTEENTPAIVEILQEIVSWIKNKENEQKVDVNYGGIIRLEIKHFIEGNLPNGMTKEEVAEILSEKLDDRQVLKQITSNPDFQYYDERYKNKLIGARNRFI